MFITNSQAHLNKFVINKRAFVCIRMSKHEHVWFFTRVLQANNVIYNTMTRMYNASDITFPLKNKIKNIKRNLIGFIMYE